jgi:Tfp pilus assembly protein PilN
VIDINLLPGSVKRTQRRGMPTLRRGGGGGMANPLAKLRGLKPDRTLLIVAVLWLVGVAGVAYLHFPSTARKIELEEEVKLAREDSVRTSAQLAQATQLNEQEKVIAQKLSVIQEIDAGRFIWVHAMDEVSRAQPPYVSLTGMTDRGISGAQPGIKLDGIAGNYFALSTFVKQLEASPFLQQVRLVSSKQTQLDDRSVLTFLIELIYEEPPPDVIQTVPVFGPEPRTATAGRE